MDDCGYSKKQCYLFFRMESSRRKRFTTRIKESLRRTPKNEGRKMPKQNLPEFPVQSQNPELTRVDLTSVEETFPGDTQAREGLLHDKLSLVS